MRTLKEMMEDELVTLEEIFEQQLILVGENPEREGLIKTPKRAERAWMDLTSGYNQDLDTLVNKAIFTSDNDELVLVKDITYWSVCEHHLLPFNGKAHVAYIPNGKIIGLSKIPRIVEMYAKRLQIQENLTTQVANCINDILEPLGVAVVMEGQHLCMQMRGVKKEGATMVTNAMLGVFRTDAAARAEFLSLLKQVTK